MASFGRYEVVDELYRTPFGYVCSARLAGTGTNGNGNGHGRITDYLVKIYDPAGAEGQASPGERGANEFLSRARLQQRMATAQAPHWARVHDLGISEAKPYYVTDYYPRTAQKLIAGRVILNAAALHEIIGSVAQGLHELREACHQPHGSLKPSNVLIGGAGEVSGAKIVLTDPVCGAPEGESDHDGDCYALGMLLYQLVTHRPFRPTAWPVEGSEEWSRLGRSALGWRTLCAALLNPDVTLRPDPNALQRSLDQLAPRGRVRVKNLLIVAGVLAIGTSATGLVVYAREAATRQSIHQARVWLDRLRNDPAFGALLVNTGRPAADESDINRVVAFDRPLTMADFTPAGFRQGRLAQTTLDQIHKNLAAAYEQSGQNLRAFQSACAKEGYVQAAGYIGSLTDGSPPDDSHLVGSIEERLRLVALLGRVPRPVPPPQARQALDKLAGSPDPDLRAFGTSLWTAFRARSVLTSQGWRPDGKVQDLAMQVALVQNWPADYDRQEFIRLEKIDLQHPTLDDMRYWLGHVRQYAWVPTNDPRRAEADRLNQRLKNADSQVRADLFPHLAPDDPQIAKYTREHDAIQAQLRDLSVKQFVQRDFTTAFEGPVHHLADQIASLPTRHHYDPKDMAAWLDGMRAQAATLQSPAIRNYWQTWIKDWTPANTNQAGKELIAGMAKNLKELDSATFVVPPDLSSDPWNGPTQGQKEQLTGELLQKTASGATAPPPQAVDQAKGQFSNWCEAVKKLKKEHTDLQATLITADVLKGHDQRWARDSFWKQQVEAPNGAFTVFMSGDVERLNAVRHVLNDLNDKPEQLIAKINAPGQRDEVVLAAWATLWRPNETTLPGVASAAVNEWSALLDQVRTSAHSKLVPDAQQKEVLAQVAQTGSHLWLEAVKSATSPATLESATRAQAELGFGPPTDRLSPVQRYNLDLFTLLNPTAASDSGPAVHELTERAKELQPWEQNEIHDLLAKVNHSPPAVLTPADAQYYLWPAGNPERLAKWQQIQTAVAARIKRAAEDLDGFKPEVALKDLENLRTSDANSERDKINDLIARRDANCETGLKLFKAGNWAAAKRPFEEAARGGSRQAMMSLGGMYRYNQGVPKSFELARVWFTRAAEGESGLPAAMVELATLDDQLKDHAGANEWFQKAAQTAAHDKPMDRGTLEELADLCLSRKWEGVDWRPIVDQLRIGISSRPAMVDALQAAIALDQEDAATAAACLQRAEETDPGKRERVLAVPMTRLAKMYPATSSEARIWYQAAADRNDAEAQSWINSHPIQSQRQTIEIGKGKGGL